MLDAVRDVCAIPADKHRLRIVTFMTDGYVGDDREVISAVHQMRGTSRWFMFGTGDSPNRFLCESVAAMGGGESDYVLLNSPTQEVAERFYRKVSFPVLSDVKVAFNGLAVKDILPKSPATDVWANRPLYFNARYTKEAKGTVTLTGFAGGKPYKQTMEIDLTKDNSDGDGLGSIWARKQVEELAFDETLKNGSPDGRHKKEIVALGLTHRILTPYTSFVAVDELGKASKNVSQQIRVPVELPEGMKSTDGAGSNNDGGALRQYVQGKTLRLEGQSSQSPVATSGAMSPGTSGAMSPGTSGAMSPGTSGAMSPGTSGAMSLGTSGGLVGAPVDPRYGQSNEVGQLADYGYSETYGGLHTFWGDDVISNLVANIGQLIGKWLTEFINGWVSDTIQFLMGMLRAMTLNNSVVDALDETSPNAANFVRKSADAIRIFGWVVLALLCYRTFREKQRAARLAEQVIVPDSQTQVCQEETSSDEGAPTGGRTKVLSEQSNQVAEE